MDLRRHGMKASSLLLVALATLFQVHALAQETGAQDGSSPRNSGYESGVLSRPTLGPWIAFAGSATNSRTGFVYGQSEREAENSAVAMCHERGGEDCEVEFTLELGCAAVVSKAGGSSWAYEPESTDQAIRSARRTCGTDCKVVWSGCTTPRSRRWR